MTLLYLPTAAIVVIRSHITILAIGYASSMARCILLAAGVPIACDATVTSMPWRPQEPSNGSGGTFVLHGPQSHYKEVSVPMSAPHRTRKNLIDFAYRLRQPDTLLSEEANMLDFLLDEFAKSERAAGIAVARAAGNRPDYERIANAVSVLPSIEEAEAWIREEARRDMRAGEGE